MKFDPIDQECPLCEQEYAEECVRKERLLQLFEEEEAEVRRRRRFPRKSKARRKFERIVRDITEVTKVNASSVELTRENGEALSPVLVTPEITELLREGDTLGVAIGFEDGAWHLINVGMIGSQLHQETDFVTGRVADQRVHEKLH